MTFYRNFSMKNMPYKVVYTIEPSWRWTKDVQNT